MLKTLRLCYRVSDSHLKNNRSSYFLEKKKKKNSVSCEVPDSQETAFRQAYSFQQLSATFL